MEIDLKVMIVQNKSSVDDKVHWYHWVLRASKVLNVDTTYVSSDWVIYN